MRLGLLSTAHINDAILSGAAGSDRVEVAAVASRSRERAEAYAREHGIPRAHGSYEELLADEGCDAIYIGLPNAMHVEWARRALEAGRHVLVEKPFSPDPGEVEACHAIAQERGLVLAEAFMWRHHPQVRRLTERVASGEIGELRLVRASFSFVLDRPDDHRWDAPPYGGALMDVGTYCVSGIRVLGGEPESATAAAVRAEGGADARLAATLRLPGGVLGVLDCAFDLAHRARLEVVGSDGVLALPDPWHGRTPRIELERDGAVEVEELEAVDSYRLELEDLAAAIAGERPPLLGRADAVGQARALALVHEAAGA